MNLLEATVTKIISHEPRFAHNKWWVQVEYEAYGVTSETELMFENREDAFELKTGYKFLI